MLDAVGDLLVRARLGRRLLALTTDIWFNDQIGTPLLRSLTADDHSPRGINHLGWGAMTDLPAHGAPPVRTPPTAPPVAARRPGAPRTFHGDSFTDPWEWLRDKTDPEVLAHLEAENAWTDRITGPILHLQRRIVGELHQHTVETDVTVPVRIGGFWYYDRTTEGLSYAAHYRVPVAGGEVPLPRPGIPLPGEQVLVDENREADGQEFFALAFLIPSPDGRLIAWGRDLAGDERWTIIVQDAATGRVVDESVTGAGQGLEWSADSSTLLYTRVDESWRQYQIWTHRVGADPGTDHLVHQEDDERFDLWFEASRDPHWVSVHSASTTTTEAWLWSRAHPERELVPVTGRTRDVLVSIEPAGDHLVLVHTATSREGTLAVAPLPADADPGAAAAGGDPRAPVAPPSSWIPVREAGTGERILGAEAHATFLLVALRSGGLTQVEVRTRDSAVEETPVPTDRLGDVWGPGWFVPAQSPVRTVSVAENPEFDTSTFRVVIESIVQPPRVVDIDPTTRRTTILKTLEVPGWDPADYEEERVWVTSRDGHTSIPVSLVHRRGAVPDGTGAGWLYGYGSYEVSMDPEFSVLRLPLLTRGVTFAIAHVRGGGELGRAWYEGGKLADKPRTFEDFIDVARWMLDSGWAAPDRLAAEGRSAGGLLMGAVANEAPELFRVILAGVPFVDALTTILDPTLPLTAGEWEEWGNPLDDAGIYRVMRSYTPYENVRDGVQYPAVFASTSLNDTRVFFVEPAKWIQRLREAATNDPVARPIVLRIEMVAGHGGKSGRYGRWDSRSEEFAFALTQLGLPS